MEDWIKRWACWKGTFFIELKNKGGWLDFVEQSWHFQKVTWTSLYLRICDHLQRNEIFSSVLRFTISWQNCRVLYVGPSTWCWMAIGEWRHGIQSVGGGLIYNAKHETRQRFSFSSSGKQKMRGPVPFESAFCEFTTWLFNAQLFTVYDVVLSTNSQPFWTR